MGLLDGILKKAPPAPAKTYRCDKWRGGLCSAFEEPVYCPLARAKRMEIGNWCICHPRYLVVKRMLELHQ